jgi:hypothetical protein
MNGYCEHLTFYHNYMICLEARRMICIHTVVSVLSTCT